MSGETLYSIGYEDPDVRDGSLDASSVQPVTPVQGSVREAARSDAILSPVPAPQQDMLVLSPRIKVTPETTSLPTTTCTFWVAIEIRGELHAADGRYDMHPGRRQSADVHLQGTSCLNVKETAN